MRIYMHPRGSSKGFSSILSGHRSDQRLSRLVGMCSQHGRLGNYRQNGGYTPQVGSVPQQHFDSGADPVIVSLGGRVTHDMIDSAESADVTAEPIEPELTKTQFASSHARRLRQRCLIFERVARTRTSWSVEANAFMEAEDNLSSPGLSA